MDWKILFTAGCENNCIEQQKNGSESLTDAENIFISTTENFSMLTS
jgi:hypothetical protein